MEFPLYLVYPLYTGIIAVVMLAVVPRDRLRRLAIFGIIYGGIGELVWLLLLSALGIARYINYGPFAFLGFPFFPPLAWIFYFIIYLHFLPEKYPWNYIFTVAAAAYSLIFSNVLQNIGIFEWRTGRILVPIIIYLTWMIIVTYTYQRFFQETKTHT